MRLFQTYSQLEAAMALEPNEPGAFRFLETYAPAGFVCANCGKTVPFPMKGGGTGYSVRREEDGTESMICYPCSSAAERADLERRGHGVLYLCGLPVMGMQADGKGLRLTDWTGLLCFPVSSHSTGRHNWAGVVHFVTFKGPDGKWWHGKQTGENTQICRVSRSKRQ